MRGLRRPSLDARSGELIRASTGQRKRAGLESLALFVAAVRNSFLSIGKRRGSVLPPRISRMFRDVLHMRTMPLTRDEAIRRLQTVESEIRRLGVRRLALFGSVLRNEARPDSDVDVLVEFAPTEKTFDRFMALADLLEDTLERRVEVVTTESLSPFIGPHILAEATDVLRAA